VTRPALPIIEEGRPTNSFGSALVALKTVETFVENRT
jgi:hypothetical protein